jgi:hypothetical protein
MLVSRKLAAITGALFLISAGIVACDEGGPTQQGAMPPEQSDQPMTPPDDATAPSGSMESAPSSPTEQDSGGTEEPAGQSGSTSQ